MELTLDANLNLSLSRLVEEGRKMQAFYGPGYTGMDNIGNSGYLNSTVQTLMSLDEYRQQYFVKGLEHLKQCKSAPNDCFYCQIAKVADGLWSGKYSQKQHRTIVINGRRGRSSTSWPLSPSTSRCWWPASTRISVLPSSRTHWSTCSPCLFDSPCKRRT
jgi:hypothetical protein